MMVPVPPAPIDHRPSASKPMTTAGFAAPTQAPPRQESISVLALPSSQIVPSGFWAGAGQPLAGTHAATVWHWSAPGHVTADPPEHVPDWQVSPVVHALLSLH